MPEAGGTLHCSRLFKVRGYPTKTCKHSLATIQAYGSVQGFENETKLLMDTAFRQSSTKYLTCGVSTVISKPYYLTLSPHYSLHGD